MDNLNPVILNAGIFHTLTEDVISYKALDLKDTEKIHRYTSDEEVSRYIGWKLMRNREETYEHIQTMQRREGAGSHLYSSVILKASGEIIGTVMLFDFNFDVGCGEIGYVFHKDYWGKGYGTRSVALLCDFALRNLKLQKLYASVVDENTGSARILIKNGFVLEEQEKGYYQIDGKACDRLVFSKDLNSKV
ncbi:ribosomal-protein-alanine N-acetyltransferase [Anaerocolumna jejuensis DSM 15929]|uniref:Ribosomal-protein-alanine N-acetyltransferase n=1 Tax=Anaerocolumna jejuensis DSM 15929 TaxID=1121322 RepID=A0A1M6SPT2_9FIRM|nr:GNAT family N-acetyltransferase [Anaerocolumna jejuensis]SHK46733.1 ribosomal-protein-alanine N-acetyltransferase [Anaerocolumna jejuensis DSM 15929]